MRMTGISPKTTWIEFFSERKSNNVMRMTGISPKTTWIEFFRY